jgi:hypothetical protein
MGRAVKKRAVLHEMFGPCKAPILWAAQPLSDENCDCLADTIWHQLFEIPASKVGEADE